MKKQSAALLALWVPLLVNCAGFTASNLSSKKSGALNLAVPSSIGSFNAAGAILCPEPSAGSTPSQTADLLQSCVDRAPVNGVVELAPTTYLIQKPLKITKSVLIKTAGIAQSAPACLENSDGRCAVIKATGSLINPDYGMVMVTAPTVGMHHIVVDGNRIERANSADANACKAGQSNKLGMNITVTGGSNHAFYRVSSVNTVCGSALAFAGTTPGIQIVENYVARAGTHNVYGLWADGITISEAPNSRVNGNHVIDATDVDLILGGCTNCEIRGNRVSKSGSFEGSSFAAFMIYSWWPGTSGDYTGSMISDNIIDCANFRCGFGLLIGDLPWHPGEVKGGTVRNNLIRGAMTGIAINDATNPDKPVRIGANTVENCGGIFYAQQGPRDFPAFYISPVSVGNVIFDDPNALAQWPRDNFAGNIANWFDKDWTTLGLSGSANPSNTGSAAVAAATGTAASPIKTYFDLYLPGCWTQEKQVYWEAWFARGGSMPDFIWTLQKVSGENPSCLIR